MSTRTETDFLGPRELTNDMYYGVQTLRGIENFHITGIPISNEPISSPHLAMSKKQPLWPTVSWSFCPPRLPTRFCKRATDSSQVNTSTNSPQT